MESDDKSELEKFRKYLENEVLTSIYPPPAAKILKSKCRKPRKSRPQKVQQTALDAKPLNGTNENKVNPIDGRKQVLTTSQWPHSVHGVIAIKFNGTIAWGSGTLIGPNIVLTAGHNLYDYDNKRYADLKSMQFLPGINGQLLPFGVVEVEKYFVSPNYIKEEKEDYGILILKKPIGEMTGYFGLACLNPSNLSSKTINITGYPGDKVASKPKTYEMWGMEGSISHFDQELGEFYYMIDTAEGQSGGGVYFQENGEYFVCGVHVRGDQTVNIGTLITKKGYQQIYNCIQENMNQMFLCLKSPYRLGLKSEILDGACLSLLFEYDLDDIRSLDLRWKEIKIEGAKILAKTASWTNLSELNLSGNRIGDEGAKALGQNTSWVNLSELNLSGNNVGDEGAKALGKNTSWISLSELNLSGNNIGDKGAQAIGQNTSWIILSCLDLSGNDICDEGAKELGKNISWINLLNLDLSGNNIGDEGAKSLGQNTSWINLLYLDLSYNKIGNEGAKAIGLNTSWINLSYLDLSGNKIGDKGAKSLGQNNSWTNLAQLILLSNKIGNEGAKVIGQNTAWISLLYLDLSYNKIGNEGAKALGKNTSWTKLSWLNLSSNKIGDEGAKAIGQNTSWTSLSYLDLSWNSIADEGAQGLMQNASWVNLSELKLEGNQISDKIVEAIAKSNIPQLYLAWNPISYEATQIISKNPSVSVQPSFFHQIEQRTSNITNDQISSIWETIENSKTHDKLRIAFILNFRSFIMEIAPPKYFKDFVISLSHFMHSRLDLNFPLPNTEEEDDELIEEPSLNSNSFLPALYGNQLCIEEGTASTKHDSDLNLNSNNLSEEEEARLSLKNAFDHSS